MWIAAQCGAQVSIDHVFRQLNQNAYSNTCLSSWLDARIARLENEREREKQQIITSDNHLMRQIDFFYLQIHKTNKIKSNVSVDTVFLFAQYLQHTIVSPIATHHTQSNTQRFKYYSECKRAQMTIDTVNNVFTQARNKKKQTE